MQMQDASFSRACLAAERFGKEEYWPGTLLQFQKKSSYFRLKALKIITFKIQIMMAL